MEKDQQETFFRRFKKNAMDRLPLRWYMFVNLFFTFAAGVLANVLLYQFGMESMAFRLPLVVGLAYVSFFFWTWCWACLLPGELLSGSAHQGHGSELMDMLEVTMDGTDLIVSCPPPSSGGGGGDVGPGDAAGLFTDEGGVLLLILALFGALFLGVQGYLVYEAPVILSETLLEFFLATYFVQKCQKWKYKPDWFGTILRATFIPFVLVLALSWGVAAVSAQACPKATRIVQVIRHGELGNKGCGLCRKRTKSPRIKAEAPIRH